MEAPKPLANGLAGWLSREGLEADDVLVVRGAEALRAAVGAADPLSPIVVVRARPAPSESIQLGEIQLDRQRNVLRLGAQEWRLRPKPAAVLAALMRNAGRVVSRAALVDQVWGGPGPKREATLRVYVHQLRQIIDAGAPRRRRIVTVRSQERGGGYLFRA